MRNPVSKRKAVDGINDPKIMAIRYKITARNFGGPISRLEPSLGSEILIAMTLCSVFWGPFFNVYIAADKLIRVKRIMPHR